MAESVSARDVSVFVGHWPFRRLPEAEPQALEARLRREGIGEALVSPLEALFDGDPQAANRWWGGALRESPFFCVAPVLNLTIADWESDLQELNPVAVRLHPNYHGYSPADERARVLLETAGEAGLPVIVQLRMQDMRAMHPMVQVPDVDLGEVLKLARCCPQTTLIVGAAKWGEAQRMLQAARDLPRLYLEISHLEYVDGLRRVVDQWGSDHLLFGTHAPLFTPTSARLKLEKAGLTEADRRAIQWSNAQAVWGERAFATAHAAGG